MTMSALSDELAQVRTKKKEFLSQIERIVPWGEWIELIRPHYYNCLLYTSHRIIFLKTILKWVELLKPVSSATS